MNSKLIAHQKEFFGKMAVDAIMSLDQDDINIKMIGVKKITGGSLLDSRLVDGDNTATPIRAALFAGRIACPPARARAAGVPIRAALTASLTVSAGVAFKKTFSYAGFEQQPKSFKDPQICLLNVELELKSEKDNAEVRIKNVADYQVCGLLLTTHRAQHRHPHTHTSG